jgi:hypothetical protein
MADSWEQANFGTPNVDLNGDPDHDGMSNHAEYLAGTDPDNANSALRITGVAAQGPLEALFMVRIHVGQPIIRSVKIPVAESCELTPRAGWLN